MGDFSSFISYVRSAVAVDMGESDRIKSNTC